MLVKEFYDFMKSDDCSEKHLNNNLKAIMNFDGTLDAKTCFLEIQRLEAAVKQIGENNVYMYYLFL